LIQVAREREKMLTTVDSGSRFSLPPLEQLYTLFNMLERMRNRYSIKIGGTVENTFYTAAVTGDTTKLFIAENQQTVNAFRGRTKLEKDNEQVYDLPFTFHNHATVSESGISPIFTCRMIQAFDHLATDVFSNLITDNKEYKDEAVQMLKIFDPHIIDIRYIHTGDRYIPCIDTGVIDSLPLSVWGDGMKKVLTILNALIGAKNGVVLVDEFETAIHFSAMKQVFSFMLQTAKRLNVQMFLSTHNIEAMDNLLVAAGTGIDSIRIINLHRDPGSGKLLVGVLPGSEVLEGRKSFDFEARA
jgi:hypothetical protein